ncbi:MAG TPA: CopG family transcriptional regulator [Bacteroidales bacterium]|nr:CopG family transcriptional regulator [Bacteroidales bacterium]
MEKRIGNALIIVNSDSPHIKELNELLSNFSFLIYSRQGVSFKERGINIIVIVFNGEVNQINALAGKIGRLQGIKIKIMLI